MSSKTSENGKFLEYMKIYLESRARGDELEIRFGTNIDNSITKIDFNNVMAKLKSMGFENKTDDYHLNINNEYSDPSSGQRRLSNIRTSISGLEKIQKYCKADVLDENELGFGNFGTTFEKKTVKYHNNSKLGPIDFNKFEFRVNYKEEKKLRPEFDLVRTMISKWSDSKKIFRFIKRFTFTHRDFPLKVDCSIVRSSKTYQTRFGQKMVPEFRIEASGLFENPEHYEIEIEIDKNRCHAMFPSPEEYMKKTKNIIKLVMGGLQGSNFPISYDEQKTILNDYINVVYVNNKLPERRIRNSDFIGPQSVSLEMANISTLDNDISIPNIRNPYTVTDKADGVRKLMFIHKTGKIYFIDMNMNVQFTGTVTENRELFNSIIDGEQVIHDKLGKYINIFLAFDIYYFQNTDIRRLPFVKGDLKEGEEKTSSKNRLQILRDTVFQNLDVKPIVGTVIPIVFRTKTFYLSSGNEIFKNCNTILTRESEGLFNYEIDGLIFTPLNTAVGNIKKNESMPLSKMTWWDSFKWKPPKFNTIDFLVTTKKTETGEDVIGNIFQNGENMKLETQLTQYKTLVLRVGFDESRHGYLNPCNDVIDDNLPKKQHYSNKSNTYKPVPFYPTDPSPAYPAYLCNIILEDKGGNKYMMTEDGKSVIEDGTVVEFRYELNEKKFWQWKPIRVRDKKTAEYKAGGKQFGNAYHVAQSIWKSIHNPVSREMIASGEGITDEIVDDDVYYNKKGKSITKAFQNFHNLFVKKLLITSVSKAGGTLIDMTSGKGGDFPKWIKAKLSFVFGLDLSRDNIQNRLDGACARFLNNKKKFHSMPYALFVQANSKLNIRSGEACFTEKGKEITNAIFGEGQPSPDLGAGVLRQFGKGKDGFDVVSNQFSIHYFFENISTLSEFLRNISECCKVGGYFIGTSYDGRKVFQNLEDKEIGESIHIIKDEVKMWEIKKSYSSKTFENNSNSLGFKIEVYQKSINKTFSEYLVNYEYLVSIMENFGFVLPSREDAKSMGLPNSIGDFNEMFNTMEEMIANRQIKKSDVGKALNMSADEKKVSFLNKYFIFKKVRDVDARQVARILSGQSISQEVSDVKESLRLQKAIKSKTKTKVKKLKSKLKIKANIGTTPIIGTPIKFKIKKGAKLKIKSLKVTE